MIAKEPFSNQFPPGGVVASKILGIVTTSELCSKVEHCLSTRFQKITIVTVAEAKDRLMSIIETALRTNEPQSYASEATPKRPIVSFTKGRGSQNVSANRKPLESATRQMNYRSEEPREDNQSYGYGERALQNSKWKRIIRLSRPQEYIDFLFLTTYLQDMIGQDYKGDAQ